VLHLALMLAQQLHSGTNAEDLPHVDEMKPAHSLQQRLKTQAKRAATVFAAKCQHVKAAALTAVKVAATSSQAGLEHVKSAIKHKQEQSVPLKQSEKVPTVSHYIADLRTMCYVKLNCYLQPH
jgi:hypothetical protein